MEPMVSTHNIEFSLYDFSGGGEYGIEREGSAMVGRSKFAMKRAIVISISCLILCLSFGGYGCGEVGREGIAYDYVVKDADVFAQDFGNSIDCYVNEVRDVFGDKNIASYFEPEGGEFYMLTTRMRRSYTVRSKSCCLGMGCCGSGRRVRATVRSGAFCGNHSREGLEAY